jgi:hypothetical protein
VLGRRRASRGVGGAASEPIDADACADPLVDALDGENSSLSGGRPLRRAAKQSMQRIEWLKSEEEAWREDDRQQEGRGVVSKGAREGARPLKAARRSGGSSGGDGGSSGCGGGSSSGGGGAAATPTNPDAPVAVAPVTAAASADATSAWAAGTLAKRQRRSTATARTEAMEEADAKKARREFEAREATKADRQVARLRRGDSAPVASSTTAPAMAPREATGDAQAPAMPPREATVGDAQAADEAEDVVLLMVAEEGPTVEAMMAAEEGAAPAPALTSLASWLLGRLYEAREPAP